MLAHEAYVWMKEVTTSDSRAFGESCRHEFEKVVLLPRESSQVSHAHAKYSVVWRLATFIPYVSRAHQATD